MNLRDEVRYGIDHQLYGDRASQRALRCFAKGVVDPEIVRILRNPVQRHQACSDLPPFLPPRLPGHGILIGEDTNRCPAHINQEWISGGMLLCGNTGSGKTSWLIGVFLQLLTAIRGVWATELYKNDFRRLLVPARRLGRQLVVLPLPCMRFNLLQPDGAPTRHLTIVVDLLGRVLDLPPRAMTIVRAACYQLYDQFGVFRGSASFPCLFDLYERIKGTRGLNVPAKEAILDRLGSLLLSLTPAVAAWRTAWNPSQLVDKQIVFELCGAAERVKLLMSSHLLFSVLYSRLERLASNERLNLVLAFEDAQRVLSGSDSHSLGLIEEPLTVMRTTGTSLVACVQSMDGIPSGLVANLGTKVMTRLGSHADWQRLGADMGMDAAQIAWAKNNLMPGLACIQLANGPWRRPFLVHVPRARLPDAPSEQEVIDSLKELTSIRTVPAAEYSAWSPYPAVAVETAKATEGPLSENERNLLRAAVEHPGLPATEYASLLGISRKRAIEIRKALVAKGYLSEHKVMTGARGRAAITLELTPAGRKILEAA